LARGKKKTNHPGVTDKLNEFQFEILVTYILRRDFAAYSEIHMIFWEA
jgi:hypothetical protein